MPKRTRTLPSESIAFRERCLKRLVGMGYPRQYLENSKLFDAEIMHRRLQLHRNSENAAFSLVAEIAVDHFAKIEATREAAAEAREQRRQEYNRAVAQEHSGLGRKLMVGVRVCVRACVRVCTARCGRSCTKRLTPMLASALARQELEELSIENVRDLIDEARARIAALSAE
jgi:hypothetical protein